MSGTGGKRRERSESFSGTVPFVKQQRSTSQAPVVEASGESVASSSTRQEQFREAALAAEVALRRYREEAQRPAAVFPYQVHRQTTAPQQSLRLVSGTVGAPPLQRIPEVVSENSSGEAVGKTERARSSSTLPLTLRPGGVSQLAAPTREVSADENYRALPRNFDPVTGRKQTSKAGRRRPSLPYVFEPLASTQTRQGPVYGPQDVFPNPHQAAGPSDSQLSTSQLQRRASEEMRSPLLSNNFPSFGPGRRNDHRPRISLRHSEQDIPPTPPLGQPTGFQTMPLSSNKSRNPPVAAAAAPQAESTSSAWSSSTESEPTPTASSIAATRERNAQLAAQLLPVQLTLPSTFSSSSTLSTPRNVASPSAGAPFGGPLTQEPTETPVVSMSAEEVASIKASAAPFAPAKPSNLSAPPIRSDSNDTGYSGDTIALPDGTQIPTVRTDFQNLKRISLPKPISENASTSGVPSVGGHVLSWADPKVMVRNDGSSRKIYSPTPQTLAAARRQSSLLQVPLVSSERKPAGEQRIPSPLSASAETPQAPQIPHSLKFSKSAPSLETPPSHDTQPTHAPVPAIEISEAQPSRGSKSVAATTQAKSDDTDVRRRDNADTVGFRNDSRRNTFGELAPSMLEEANRKLFMYQMQQLDQEAREKGVGSSRQSAPALVPSATKEAGEKLDKKTEASTAATAAGLAGTTSIVRRESTASQRSRRDSIGSATTAFDSPTKEEFPPNLFRQTSGTSGARNARVTARAAVAPPSDVPEMQEPDEVETVQSGNSDDGEGTEIDEHEGTYDLSPEKRVPFVVDTYNNDDEDPDARALRTEGERSEFRFIPISSVKAGKARRPRTRDTRVSFRSNPSHIDQRPGSRQHGAAPACRQCFRAGFDCAMNLQLGEGTAARKAFQDFVAAGGLNAFSIRDGAAMSNAQYPANGSMVDSQGVRGGRITVGEALGRNYVDKLGEVAFGESALSRPVTRGMYNELLEEKQEQERRKKLVTEHKPWSADVEDEIDASKTEQQRHSTDRVKRSLSNSNKDRRLSQMTLREGVEADQLEALGEDDARQVLLNNIMRSSESQKRGALEEGEIVDIDPADYEDEEDHDGSDARDDDVSTASSESDIVVWADRWSAWAKLRQLLAFWVYVFALQALASGYSNTVYSIVADEHASQADAILLQLGSLSYNGSQGGGLFFANLLVGFGRQRLTLITLVGVGVVCVIAGFIHNVFAILACQTVLGLLSGFVLFLSLATVLDLFATSRGRLFGIGSIALVLLGGQLAGPWISKLVLDLLSWSWTYWLTLIVAGVLIVYVGIATRETLAFVLFRREALRLKRTGRGWTPEPQLNTQPRQMFSDDLGRPFRLMRYNPMLVLLALGLAALGGMYMFLFSGLQVVFIRTHGLSSTNAALAITVSAAIGLVTGVLAICLINSRKGARSNATGFVTKARPLYLDEKGHIDTRRPLRVKTESLLIPALIATAVFSFALYTLALASSFAATWFLLAFAVVLATAALIVTGVAIGQYVLDGYSPPRKVTLRDVVAREDPSTPTLLQRGDEDRFTSYSRRTAGRLAAAAAAAARFSGGHGGRHGGADRKRLQYESSNVGEGREAWLDGGEEVTKTRDKRWLDETGLAAFTSVVSLLFTVCSILSFISFEAFGKLSFGAFSVIFASVSLLVLLLLLCVYLYGAKPRAWSLILLDEADKERAGTRRAKLRERRALQRQRSNSQSHSTGQQQHKRRSAPLVWAKRVSDALGYKPLPEEGLDVYRRSSPQLRPPPQLPAERKSFRPVRTPAPRPMRQEVDDRHSTATAAAEGMRELWLAKFIANRDGNRRKTNANAGNESDMPNNDVEAPPAVEDKGNSSLMQTMKGWSGTMLGSQDARPAPPIRDAIGRTLGDTDTPRHNFSPSTRMYASPPQQLQPLSPPPRTQPRASVSVSPHQDGFEIVRFERQDGHDERPHTPVTTRKSVDMSNTKIMARSHSQPLNLYSSSSQSPRQATTRQNFGLGL